MLKKMGRKMLTEKFRVLIDMIRSHVSGVAITTDLMVGFPGETEKDFEESLSFVKEINFSGGHVFRYSARPGTAAEKFDHLVSEQEKKARSKLMRLVISRSEFEYKKKFTGQNVSVLWEKTEKLRNGDFLLSGLTGNYLRVDAVANEDLQNMVSSVCIKEAEETRLFGEIIS